ncbi:MAG: zinc dependent phospholipase C family protein [Bacteroidales bacterium]
MSKTTIKKTLLLLIAAAMFAVFIPSSLFSWGFYGHKKINRMAVFTLPPQMIGFYKKHIEYISEHGSDPDKRKYADEKEAVRHYIDIDYYGDKPFDVVPKKWKDAVAKYTEDSLNLYGINPWWTEKMYYRLVEAFKDQDVDKILYISANLGHYIADGCTPLHNTQFYDGKIPEQKGIHVFWESRIPELFGDDYDFFVGQAEYIDKPLDKIWENIKLSFATIDTIFMVQKKMNLEFPGDKQYTFENRGQTTVKVFSKEYSLQFSALLNGMVERQMRRAVKTVGSFWYTAWVNAGQPDLTKIEDKDISDAHKKELEEQEKLWKTGKVKGRPDPQ